ncbi:hypothetical protein BCR42DRAFT_405959 [Absidia repens]|uniref:Uncharacterized protein n=1 Tax=Absidia repens TaxID=90262 RepID=A0A1X2IU94_9FUNG|nr:hypothetical protein BCR42DRAFT_405959 [Absidia repens]
MAFQSTDQSILLKQILERSKLQASKVSQQDLPSIDRGLDQIDSQTKSLSGKLTQKDDNVDIRAHYFLAQSGVNTQVLMRELGTIHLGVPIEQRQPIQDTDVDGYFHQKRTQTIIDLIQSEKQEIIQNLEKAFEEDLHTTWAQSRERICYGILQGKSDTTSSTDISKLKLDMTKVTPADFS